MRTRSLVCAAALPIAVVLAGCESGPMKMLGSILPGESKTEPQDAQRTIPPQVIVAPDAAPAQTRPAPAAAASRGAADLQTGINKYEDGEYPDASRRLQTALNAGLTTAEAVRAHKYLAFIHCASRREKQCRAEFKKALTLDPGFQLNAAEAGHPMWGPVFRDVKQRG